MDREDRRALGFLLDIESLLFKVYQAAKLVPPRRRWIDGFRGLKINRKIIAAFVDEALRSTASHVDVLQSRKIAMGETEVTISPVDLEAGLCSVLDAAGIPNGLFVSDRLYRLLFCAFVVEDVAMTATHGAIARTNDRWMREYLPGLLSSQGSRAAIARTILFAADQSDTTNAIAVHRQKTCGLQSTVFQANDHGVGTLSGPSIMPTDPRHLGWGRTIEQCARIVSGDEDGHPGCFFPAGVSLLKMGEVFARNLVPVYFEAVRASAGAGQVIVALEPEHVDIPSIELPIDDFDLSENTSYQPARRVS